MKLALIFFLALFVFPLWAQTPSSADRLRIGPGDLLSMEVFDVPELKQEIRVSDRGDAEFVLLGKLHLADLTVEDAAHLLASQLEAQHLVVHPQVTLLVREYATQGVAVTGEVRKPGVYQVLGPRTLAQVLTEAGGLTETASPKITIQRRNGERLTASVREPDGNSTGILLQPGDTVTVLRAGIAYLVGDVARSGGYVMNDNGELSVAQLVAVGGGLLPTAKASKARLVRKTANGREQLEVDLKKILQGKTPDLPLQSDDILFVPNSALRSAATRLQNITHVMSGAKIGSHCNLGDHVFVESGVSLGDNVTVKNGVALWDGVTAENNVFIGPNAVFTNDRNPRAAVKKTKDQFLPTLLREGASLGANVTVVCGITVGRYAFAGAGAVLTRDVPDHALVLGNPAHQVGYVCECGEKLRDDLTCRCGHNFAKESGRLVRVPF